jgi:hypothetical protein
MHPTNKTIAYPPEANVVLDVTKAPYFLDNTGTKDCTRALVAILDDMAQISIDGMKNVMDVLTAKAKTEKNFILPGTFENAVRNGNILAVFPDPLPPSRIIYFPKGTYLISDTISYSMDNLQNGLHAEMFWRIRMVGESQDETILKLQDRCHGFEYGMSRPVVSFIRGNFSNIAMTNFLRNLTIDVGQGNPGAIALEFMGDNCAGVENVTLRSSDPKFRGQVGLSTTRDGATCCHFKNITIDGFEIGMRFHMDGYLVLENIHLRNQTVRGISVKDNAVVSIRGLVSENATPLLQLNGHNALVNLLDAVAKGGGPIVPAIEFLDGQLFLRNFQTEGYQYALVSTYVPGWGSNPIVDGKNVAEYVSGNATTLSDRQEKRSLDIQVEQTPDFAWESDFSQWVHPGTFGAIGDGKTDDTQAIQRAMDSGKPIIYFQQGTYLVNAPIRIPPSVQQVNFMFVDFVAGEDIKQMTDKGMFTVVGESKNPLLLEDVFSFERNHGKHYFIEHASTRTLVMRNLHTQSCAAYRNSVPGGAVFMENIATTTGNLSDTYEQPCFVFQGQKAWCAQIDPEYTPDKIINDGSTLVILGFKTEGEGAAITTKNGGRTEAFGGFVLFGPNTDSPMMINDESDMDFNLITAGCFPEHCFKVAVREIIDGTARDAGHDLFPKRYNPQQYTVPLYVGRKKQSA